jgi:hypothetical protein
MADLFITNDDAECLFIKADEALQILPDVLRELVYEYWEPNMLYNFFVSEHMSIDRVSWPDFRVWWDNSGQLEWRVGYESNLKLGLHMYLEREDNEIEWSIQNHDVLWEWLVHKQTSIFAAAIKQLAPKKSIMEISLIENYLHSGMRLGILQDATRYWFIRAARERGHWNPDDKSICRCTHMMRCSFWEKCLDEESDHETAEDDV